VGAGLALIVLLVVQAATSSGSFVTRTDTVTSTTTAVVLTIPDSYEQVSSAYANHLLLLESRNVSALLSGYENNATVEWTGAMPGLNGNYAGRGNGSGEIGKVFEYFPGEMVNLTLTNENQTIAGVQGGYWIINSTFDWVGYIHNAGNISGIVSAQDSYSYVGNTWLIARETWNFAAFDCNIPACPL